MECRTLAAIPITQRGQRLAAPVLIVAGVGNIGAAQVHAKDISGLSRCGRRTFELDMQEVGAIAALDQRGTRGHVAFQSALLVVAKRGFEPCTLVQERQAERPIPFPETEDTLVVVNRRGLKGRMGSGFHLQRGTDTGNGAYRQIGRQAELCPDIRVAGVLHLHLVRGVLPPCHVRNEVAGVGKGDKRRVNLSALLWGGRQFTGKCAYGLHRGKLYHICTSHVQTAAKAWKSVSSSGNESPTLPRAQAHFL